MKISELIELLETIKMNAGVLPDKLVFKTLSPYQKALKG